MFKCYGPYRVGCADVMTKSNSIPEKFDAKTLCSSNLGSFMRIFYPCVDSSHSLETASWFPQLGRSGCIKNLLKLYNLGWISEKLITYASQYTIPATVNAPLLDQESWKKLQNLPHFQTLKKLPVVIFSHGLIAHRNMYSCFCTQLASEGYLVVSVEHRDGSTMSSLIKDSSTDDFIEIPHHEEATNDCEETTNFRNMQLNKRSEEISMALDLLEKLDSDPDSVHNCLDTDLFKLKDLQGRIDLTRAVMIGHSFGGATAVDVVKKDDRFRCAIGLDVWFTALREETYNRTNCEKPSLLLYTEHFNWKNNLRNAFKYAKRREEGFTEILTLKGADHYDQCDVTGAFPKLLHPLIRGTLSKRIPHHQAIHLQRKLISDYFSKCLQCQDSSPVKILEAYDLPEEFIVGSNIQL